jgi:hypothetical protein
MRVVNGYGVSLNGFDLAGLDEFGVSWKINALEGWDDMPGSTGKSIQKEYSDGGWVDEAFLEPLSLRALGRIYAPDRPLATAALGRLKRVVPVRSLRPLAVMSDGLLRHRMVRVEGKPKFPPTTDQHIAIDLQLSAPDPRIFSGDGAAGYTYSASTALPQTSGGVQVGVLQAPFQVTADTVSGSVLITNQGDATPPVKVLITNAVNPSISTADGQRMSFALTVGSNQTLEVDLDRKTVKLNGVNRRNSLSGQWITPKAGTELNFNASTYNATARMTVQWSDAWR